MLNKDIIQSKINYFIMTHPEYKLYKEESLISILVENNFLTKEEVECLNSKYGLFYEKISHENKKDYKELLGAQFTIKETKGSPKERLDSILKELGLTLNEESKINLENFTVESLTKKFNVKPNDISESNFNVPELKIKLNHPQLGEINISLIQDGTNDVIILNKDFSLFLSQNGINSYMEIYNADKDFFHNKNFDLKGNILSEQRGNKYITYSNNYPFIESSNGEWKNLLVEDLLKDLKIFGSKKQLEANILNRITSENVEDVVFYYKTRTGKDLLTEIKKDVFIENELKTKLVNHIKTLSTGYIAETLFEDIYGLGSGNLKDDLNLINKDNIQDILKRYLILATNKDIEFYDSFKLTNIDGLSIVPLSFVDYLNGGVGNGLIKNINDEWGLSNIEKKDIIEKIIQIVIESIDSNSEIYGKDIKTDILEHKNDFNKLDVDLIRWGNRLNSNQPENITLSNGKIDTPYKQHGIGDCWLISGLTSILNKDIGKKHIEKLIKSEPENDYVEIFLPGPNKSYRIEKEYIANCTHLADGDGDIRAIELAIDRFFKERAYENNSQIFVEGKTCDIDGNELPVIFWLLLGKCGYTNTEDCDWNSKDKFYTVGLKDDFFTSSIKEVDLEKEITKLSPEHAYSVLNSDEKYLYLYDPNNKIDINQIDKSSIIKIPLNDAKYLICSYGEISTN